MLRSWASRGPGGRNPAHHAVSSAEMRLLRSVRVQYGLSGSVKESGRTALEEAQTADSVCADKRKVSQHAGAAVSSTMIVAAAQRTTRFLDTL